MSYDNLQYSGDEYVFTSRMENSVDFDQLASEKPADLDVQCFHSVVYQGLAWY